MKLSRRQAKDRTGHEGPEAPGGGSRGAWRQRRALPLLVALPAVALLVLAAGQLRASVPDLGSYQRAHFLAQTGGSVAGLAQALESERADTATFVVLGPLNGGRGSTRSSSTYQLERGVLQRTYAATDRLAGQVMRQVSKIGAGYPAPVRAQAAQEMTAIRGLADLRRAATTTDLNAFYVVREYSSVIQAVLGFNKPMAGPRNDPGLARTLQARYALSQITAEESSQAAILTSGLAPDLFNQGSFGSGQLTAITGSMVSQQVYAREFAGAATAAQLRQYESVVDGPPATRAMAQEQAAVTTASHSGAPQGPAAADASTGLSYPVSGLRALEVKLGSSAADQAGSRHRAAEVSVAVYGALLAALAVLLALTFVTPVLRRRRSQPGRPPEVSAAG